MFRVALVSFLFLIAAGCEQPEEPVGVSHQAGVVWGGDPHPGPGEGFPTLAETCPCATAPTHGLYVECAINWAKAAAAAGVIGEHEQGDVVSQAAKSSCGPGGSGAGGPGVKPGPPGGA